MTAATAPALSSPVYPAMLVALAAGHGHAALFDPRDCDIALLGPRSGPHAAVLAAANPGCRVWLLGPCHDAGEIALWQEEAALDNLSLVESDIDAIASLLLPDFSLIALNRLANFVDDRTRACLLRCCSDRLTGDGLLHIAYDALPGASSLAILRDIARAVCDENAEPQTRLVQALDYLDELVTDGAPLMEGQAGHCLRALGALPASLQRQLLLEPDWTALHVTGLSAQCEAAGLAFAGSTSRLLSADAATTAGRLTATAGAATDPLSIEQHLAFAMNDAWRGDLYRSADVPAGDGPLDWLAFEHAVALGSDLPQPPGPAPDHASTDRFNALALRRAIASDNETVVLASALIGGGVRLSAVDALYLAARQTAGEDDAAGWAADYLNRAGKRIRVPDGDIETAPAAAVLASVFQERARTVLPDLARFGLLSSAGPSS